MKYLQYIVPLVAATEAVSLFNPLDWLSGSESTLQTPFNHITSPKDVSVNRVPANELAKAEMVKKFFATNEFDPITKSYKARLLETGEGEYVVAQDDEQVNEQRRKGKFMDITDHYDFYEQLKQQTVEPIVVDYPTNVSHYDTITHKLLPTLDKANLVEHLTNFSSYYTRYYKSNTGLASSLWLFNQVLDVVKSAGREKDIEVSTFDHPWIQKSVIARIHGKNSKSSTDASKKKDKSIIVISAHLDSANLILPSILAAPGADDNGSGTVTILEVFRALIAGGFEPLNTVEFHWYSAEEGGLLGSQAVLTEYKARRVPIKAQLQQDMTGYVKDPANERFGVITDFVNADLTKFVELIIKEYTQLPYVKDVCGYACSDHASGTKLGYPSAFVIEDKFSDTNPFVHTIKDTLDRLSFDHMLQHAKLTLSFAYELGHFSFAK
jgi:leucyl aminopeptidase